MNQKLSKKTRRIIFVGALVLATSLTGYIAADGELAGFSKVNLGVTQVQAATQTSDDGWYSDKANPDDDWYSNDATPTPTDDWYYDDANPTDDWYDDGEDDLYYYDDVMLGDVNLDENVNAIDFALMRKSLLGIDPAFTGDKATAADVNKDGQFNAIDFARIRQFLLGIIKSF